MNNSDIMKARNMIKQSLTKCLKDTFINNLFFLYIKLIKSNNKIIKNLFDLAYNSILIVMILFNSYFLIFFKVEYLSYI